MPVLQMKGENKLFSPFILFSPALQNFCLNILPFIVIAVKIEKRGCPLSSISVVAKAAPTIAKLLNPQQTSLSCGFNSSMPRGTASPVRRGSRVYSRLIPAALYCAEC
jgi:hypothetical protein